MSLDPRIDTAQCPRRVKKTRQEKPNLLSRGIRGFKGNAERGASEVWASNFFYQDSSVRGLIPRDFAKGVRGTVSLPFSVFFCFCRFVLVFLFFRFLLVFLSPFSSVFFLFFLAFLFRFFNFSVFRFMFRSEPGRHHSRDPFCETPNHPGPWLCKPWLDIPDIGDRSNTVSESTVSSTEPSDLFWPHRVPGESSVSSSQPYYLCAKANSPSFMQNSARLHCAPGEEPLSQWMREGINASKSQLSSLLKSEAAWFQKGSSRHFLPLCPQRSPTEGDDLPQSTLDSGGIAPSLPHADFWLVACMEEERHLKNCQGISLVIVACLGGGCC